MSMSMDEVGGSNLVDNVFSNTPDPASSFNSIGDRVRNASRNGTVGQNPRYIVNHSQVPIADIRANVFFTENLINELIRELDANLEKVNINPYSNIDLEISHKAVWKDAVKHHEMASELPIPDYITYEQYVYASQHLCRSCRDFVKNYDLTISHTSFGYLLEIKRVLKSILNEITLIKNIAIHDFGDSYREETESEVAKHMHNWVNAALHYVKEISKEITTSTSGLPTTEVEKLTEGHAARFQSFFAIKVNSYTSEIQTITNLLKRDSVDIADIFYSNYLLPALKFKSSVIDPLAFDFSTTQMAQECPTLAGEMLIAENSVTGNLGSVITDYVERRIQFASRMEAILQLINLKRRYVSYIIQLESIATQRVRPLVQVSDENIPKYKEIFSTISVDSENRNNLRSYHGQLDGLDQDDHPQYLRRDGGIITGAIDLAPGATIGGISIAEHTHSGLDGSSPVNAVNIDYTSARDEYFSSEEGLPYSNMILAKLEQNTLIGGNVNYEATFEIEIDDLKVNTYEFEILYNEI